jgi:hypothetical protein
MAHFAKIDAYNVVTWVVVVANEDEHRGEELLNDMGFTGRWIQTSVNATIRGKFASIGDTYDEINDVFVSPQS